jgi:hypothetical protein
MAISITVDPAAPIATISACNITVTGALQNDDGPPDLGAYPIQAAKMYYFLFTVLGYEFGRSYVFGTDENGGHVFPGYIFPHAGEWAVWLWDVAEDSGASAILVTVTEP